MRVTARQLKLLRSGIALAWSFALAGCSLRLNDPVAQPQHSVNTGSGCLTQAGDVLEKFQKGELTASEHAAFFDCTNKAITTFLSYADGKNKDFFAPAELGKFLTKYFLQGKEIPPGLLQEAMALKAAVVGGSAEHLSRADLRRVLEAGESLRAFTGALRPLMPLDAGSFLARGFSGAEFDAAMRTFVDASASFGDSVQGEQGAYPFERLGGLVRELRGFLYPNGVAESHWTGTALRFAAAMAPAKQLLIAPPRDQITTSDWPKIYRLAPRYYASLLRAEFYLGSPFNTFQDGGLATIEKIYADFVDTFNFVVDQHPGQQISSDEIDDLVKTLADQQMLPCKPGTARQFVKVLFGRLLGAEGMKLASATPATDAANSAGTRFAITKESLARFEENFRYLLEGAHAIEALYRPKFGASFVNGSLGADEIAGTPSAQLLAATTQKSPLSIEAVGDVVATPRAVRTVFPASDPVVTIPERGTVSQFSFVHMLKIHGLRSLNRLLFQAYAAPNAGFLTPGEIDAFVSDVFPFLAELHLADESLRTSVPKRLREASLFLYASDGGTNLSMNEALEMEALLLSTVSNAPRVHQAIAEACLEPEKKGANEKAQPASIPAACYREQFARQAGKIWSYLPGLARYVGALSPADRLRLFDNMASFLHKRAAGDGGDVFTIGDTQCFLQLPYYVELLFSRFDANGDGVLDNTEAVASYPVFRPFIAEKAGEKGYRNPKDHQAIFNFLLAYRELPTNDKWDYAARRYLLGDKPFRDDRGQIVEIFEKLLSL